MTRHYQLAHIDLSKSKASKRSAHPVHRVKYQAPGAEPIAIIYKENKHHDPAASVLEAAFSELAKLFMMSNLTPDANLVMDEKQRVTGISIENIKHCIARKKGALHRYYFKVSPKDSRLTAVACHTSLDIPAHFLNEVPHDFLESLLAQPDESRSIDYDSLASVLGVSYLLEEDDLHKGNIGFYVTLRDNKPHYVFFKIDHDMMLSDSVLSKQGYFRLNNALYSENAFAIHPDDLRDFPVLTHSKNHYWPTHSPWLANPLDARIYTRKNVQAVSKLKNNEAFKRAKWRQMLRLAIIPASLIQLALTEHLESNDPKYTEIAAAVIERQRLLKINLLSLPEFRDYVTDHGADDFSQIRTELSLYFQALQLEKTEIDALILDLGNQYVACAHLNLDARDSPGDVATKLGLLKSGDVEKYWPDLAERTNDLEHDLQGVSDSESPTMTSYEDFSLHLDRIGKNTNLSLKSRQQLALHFIRRHLTELSPDQINQFETDLLVKQGHEIGIGSLLFLNEFEHEHWLERRVLPRYGRSPTNIEIRKLIRWALAYHQYEKTARGQAGSVHYQLPGYQSKSPDWWINIRFDKEQCMAGQAVLLPALAKYGVKSFDLRDNLLRIPVPPDAEAKYQQIASKLERKLSLAIIGPEDFRGGRHRIGAYTHYSLNARHFYPEEVEIILAHAPFSPMNLDLAISYSIQALSRLAKSKLQDADRYAQAIETLNAAYFSHAAGLMSKKSLWELREKVLQISLKPTEETISDYLDYCKKIKLNIPARIWRMALRLASLILETLCYLPWAGPLYQKAEHLRQKANSFTLFQEELKNGGHSPRHPERSEGSPVM